MDEITKLQKRLAEDFHQPHFTSVFEHATKNKPHVIRKGTLLFNDGDPLGRLYLIKKGFVKLYRTSEEGRETISYLLGPNYVLGVRALLSHDECAKHNAEALTDLTVVTLSRKEYFSIVTSHPEYIADLVRVFLDRLTYTERKLEGFIVSSTTARVANFLADCAIRFGIKKGKIVQLPLELTHQRIGEFVGAFRESVTIAIHVLEQEKIIMVHRGKVTILNLPKLKIYATFGKRKQPK